MYFLYKVGLGRNGKFDGIYVIKLKQCQTPSRKGKMLVSFLVRVTMRVVGKEAESLISPLF